MPAVAKKTHAARNQPASRKPQSSGKKASRKKSSRKKSPGLYIRAVLRIEGWRDKILSYKTRAILATAAFLTITLYITWAAGGGAWLRDEVDDATRSALVAAGLSVEQIRVEGRNRADLEDVREAIGIIQGESILHYDLEEARSRLESLQWVEEAQVIRFWPKTIHVVLRERTPIAIWQQDGELHLVDAEGFVIDEFDETIAAPLPLIVGPGAPGQAAALFAALKAYPELEDNVASAIRIADRRWNVRLHNGVEIRLPAENIHLALSRVVKYDAEHDLLRQEIKSVDLRLPDRIYLRLTDEEADRLWTEQTRT